MKLLCREVATDLVADFEIKIRQFRAVTDMSARCLLQERYELLLKDSIRNKGPEPGTFYPWNIIDYLCNENPRGNK